MLKFSNEVPIYRQIMDLILKDIINGTYRPGEQIPSVRELSRIYSANPNTCQRAVAELTEMELLVSFSTNGKFVTENRELLARYKRDTLRELTQKFWEEVKAMGYSIEEVIQIMKKEGEKNGDYRA